VRAWRRRCAACRALHEKHNALTRARLCVARLVPNTSITGWRPACGCFRWGWRTNALRRRARAKADHMHSSPPAGLLMQPSNYARGLTARPTPARQSELEDLCFAVLQPAEYRALRRGLDALWGLSSLPAGAGEGAPADAPPAAAGARGGGAAAAAAAPPLSPAVSPAANCAAAAERAGEAPDPALAGSSSSSSSSSLSWAASAGAPAARRGPDGAAGSPASRGPAAAAASRAVGAGSMRDSAAGGAQEPAAAALGGNAARLRGGAAPMGQAPAAAAPRGQAGATAPDGPAGRADAAAAQWPGAAEAARAGRRGPLGDAAGGARAAPAAASGGHGGPGAAGRGPGATGAGPVQSGAGRPRDTPAAAPAAAAAAAPAEAADGAARAPAQARKPARPLSGEQRAARALVASVLPFDAVTFRSRGCAGAGRAGLAVLEACASALLQELRLEAQARPRTHACREGEWGGLRAWWCVAHIGAAAGSWRCEGGDFAPAPRRPPTITAGSMA